MGAEGHGFRVLGAEALQNLRPQHSGSPHLGHFHEIVLALVPEEGEALGKGIYRKSCLFAAADVFHAVSQGVAQFQVTGGAAFLDVVAGNGNGVEFRHILGGVFENITDDTHGHGRRVDVGVADHEFLQNIVLDGALENLPVYPLFNAGTDEEGQNREHRAVHGHGYGHLIQRNAIKEDVHVQHGAYGNAGFAYVPYHSGIVRIIAAVGRKGKGNGQPLLPCSQISFIESIGFFGSGEAGVLADSPRAEYIHGGVRSPEEGRNTAHEIQMTAFFVNIFRIERAYGNAFQRGVIQIIVGFPGGFFQPLLPGIVIAGRVIFQIQFCKIRIHCHIILPPLP